MSLGLLLRFLTGPPALCIGLLIRRRASLNWWPLLVLRKCFIVWVEHAFDRLGSILHRDRGLDQLPQGSTYIASRMCRHLLRPLTPDGLSQIMSFFCFARLFLLAEGFELASLLLCTLPFAPFLLNSLLLPLLLPPLLFSTLLFPLTSFKCLLLSRFALRCEFGFLSPLLLSRLSFILGSLLLFRFRCPLALELTLLVSFLLCSFRVRLLLACSCFECSDSRS
jgi:hypothetical protein